MGSTSAIRQASTGDRAGVVETVVAAFAKDPAWRFLLGDRAGYAALAPAFAGALFDLRAPLGNVWVSDDLASVAMWRAPRGEATPPEQTEPQELAGPSSVAEPQEPAKPSSVVEPQEPARPSSVAGSPGPAEAPGAIAAPGLAERVWARYRAEAGAAASARLAAYDAAVAAVAAHDRHWYLGVLATHPARRHEGLACAVLAPVLGRADASGLACCLETSTAANRRFYAKRGFTETTPAPLAGGPPIWWLRRSPRRSADGDGT